MPATPVLSLDPACFDPDALAPAGQLLREGKLVVFPTETVYGLGANALDAEAARSIYTAKGRPSDNPLIVHLPDTKGLPELCRHIPEEAEALFAAFAPGPLTVVLPKRPIVPDAVSGGLDTVAVRIPAPPIARALLRQAGVPVAAPSANRSGRPSPTRLSHCREDLDGRVALFIDGGPCGVGLESTVLSLAGQKPTLLRPGGITVRQLEAMLGEVAIDPVVLRQLEEGLRPLAPGMKYRHYAPKAQMTLAEGSAEAVADWLAERSKEPGAGILCWEEDAARMVAAAHLERLGPREDIEAQARALFDALRRFDGAGVSAIYGPLPGEDGLGLALRNRLLKAAGHRVVRL